MFTTIPDAAHKYASDGYSIVRCKYHDKAPSGKGWRDGHSPSEFKNRDNIGILAGVQKDGSYLVDVDLDSDEAKIIARDLLVDAPLKSGRDMVITHYWYKSLDEIPTRRYLDIGGACIMEIRGTGVQTIVQPSVHPSGDLILWHTYKPFNQLYGVDIDSRLKLIAGLAFLSRHWPEPGSRQHMTMALTGFLLHNNYGGDIDVEVAMNVVLTAAHDKSEERLTAVRNTIKAFESEKHVTGGPTIRGIVGEEVYNRFIDFIDLEEPVILDLPEEYEDAAEKTVSTTLISAYDLVTSDVLISDEIVEGFIWKGKTHWLYSDPNAGKTMLALAIALHVASGKEFAGRDVQEGPVVIIEEDSSLAVIASYLDNFASIYDINFLDLPIFFNKEQGIRIFKPRDVDRIHELVESCSSPPKLVIFDSCERILPSNSFNSREVDPLDRLLKDLANKGIANLVLDHTNKSQYDNPTDMDVLYGSRAKSAIADIMFQLQGSIKLGALQGTFTKFRGDTPPGIDIFYDGDKGFQLRDRQLGTKTEHEGIVLGWFLSQQNRWFDEVFIEEGILPINADSHDVKRLHRTLNSMATRRMLRRRKDLEGITFYKRNV